MDVRLALYELAARHHLDAPAARELQHLAGLNREPAALAYWLPRGVAVLAAALGGLGIIFWIAANWDTLGRFGRFALLEFFFLAMCLGALWKPAARTPLCLLALLAIGGLFAYFGQTYQTGADPWQLFALWAVLSLPLCLSARSDVLWTPWALIVITAIALWVHAHTGHRWRAEPDDLAVHAIGWGAALALIFVLSPVLQRLIGAGPWALRTALTMTTIMITMTALAGLFSREIAAYYWLGLVMLIAAAGVLASPRLFEIYGLSAVSLGLNTLLVAGLAHALFQGARGDKMGSFLMLGLAAAGLLAATVSLILRLSRRYEAIGASA
ncbi:MAG: hypothetical protein A3I66_14805 [Burkholderiales bacterium RIFCSPLOWO2_02_FULL_57_36]|nr:MAG: hypothetical protein A3I66_14805 [Burkholderiales bacterium RIFCSPLOWO2_02_FULL_57_36]